MSSSMRLRYIAGMIVLLLSVSTAESHFVVMQGVFNRVLQTFDKVDLTRQFVP